MKIQTLCGARKRAWMFFAGALLGLTAGGGCTPSTPPTETQPDPAPVAVPVTDNPLRLPPDEDLYYGVYLQGHKVGWMRSTFKRAADAVVVGLELRASVGGLGQVSKVELEETRHYDPTSGRLQTLVFSQSAATGAVEIKGTANGDTLALKITAAGSTRTQEVPAQETLEDALAVLRLVQSKKPGDKKVARRFEPSLLKNLEITHRLGASQSRLVGGLKTMVWPVTTVYDGLQVKESSWVAASGKLLETKVGGFFVARLEPPEVAKRLDYSRDILVGAVVKTPSPIQNPEDLDALSLRIKGFGEFTPPSSERQQVVAKKEWVSLKLRRDPRPPVVALSQKPNADSEYLAPTPFLQSDAPEIVQTATRVVGDAQDVFTAVERLTRFVYEHVRDEYVPAYSNALESLKSGRGDCTEHSVLFVALARALGIPARMAVGVAYWPAGGGFGWHAWAEVKVKDRWYAVDPTWNQPIADATHIKLAGGGLDEQAAIVMLLGQLEVVDVAL